MPAKMSRFAAVAEEYGFSLDPNKGKHNVKLRRDGERPYTVPCHNGMKTEISDHYIKAFCRQYAINRDEFVSKL
jgi:predicted RNA binding protein YcfA (HicA-like mRNA interferase family)